MSTPALRDLTTTMLATEAKIRLGGGPAAIERQHEKGRLTARERVDKLIDPGSFFQELGLWAAHEMYKEYGGAPAAGVVTGIGQVHGRHCMIIANDATVKAGAFFPMTCKKIIRAQTIAMEARLPLIYLVDSAGVFLPLQEDVFPDTDDFGRIFRNNAVISAAGIPQIAAIMGYCVAGGGYLPVLCDTLLMTEGSGLYLAGPALVKAAIGQEVTDEELGGASMHASISGTIDFKEKDDEACIERLRGLIHKYGATEVMREVAALQRLVTFVQGAMYHGTPDNWREEFGERMQHTRSEEEKTSLIAEFKKRASDDLASRMSEHEIQRVESMRPEALAKLYSTVSPPSQSRTTKKAEAARESNQIYDAFTVKPGAQYDVKHVIACLVDAKAVGGASPGGTALQSSVLEKSSATQSEAKSTALESSASKEPGFDEYKADFGQSLVCGYATIGGHACGIVANQKKLVQRTMPGGKTGPTKAVQMPGVIYDDSADKAARFIMDCNQRKIPIIFLHDTTGFMVGRDSEQGGIIRAGAKMVNAMSNCVVPKIVVITGGSYGAGNYAMCGRAFDQFMAFAWPSAKCAVMGANQATGVLTTIEEASRKRKGETIDPEAHEKIYAAVHAAYTQQAAITHAASRGWVDRMVEPHKTRDELIAALSAANQGWDYSRDFKTGVLQT